MEGEDVEFPDYPEIARLYALAISEKRVPACRYVILAAKRYLRMLEAAKSGEEAYVFSPAHACDFLSFYEKLPFVEDNWRNVESAPAEPWWVLAACATYGFRSRQTGARWTSEVYLEIPRKHAKSHNAASIGLFDLVSGKLAPQILIAARSEKQSNKVYKPIKRWSEMSDLSEEFRLQTNLETTRCLSNGGEVVKLSSMGEREDGWNPTTAILEELHAQDPSVFQVIDSARGARGGQLIFSIGTAGHSPSGQGWETRKKAISILEGKIEDDKFFSLLYTLDEDDYQDENGNKDFNKILTSDRLDYYLAKANPMLGVSLDPDVIKGAARKAVYLPTDRTEFLRTRFNIWANQASGLVDPGSWDACSRKISLPQFFGQKCWLGVDMCVYHDMAALAAIFEVGDSLAVFARMFVPQGSHIVNSPNLHSTIMGWADAGYLTIVPGEMMDPAMMKAEIKAFHEVFNVQKTAFDPAFSTELMFELQDEGYEVTIFPVNGKTMTLPTDDLIARIAGKRLIHDGNPCFGWNVLNAVGERRVDQTILPKKDAPNSERKIDAFVAACFANGVRLNPDVAPEKGPKKPIESPYAKRGLIGQEEWEKLYGD